MKEIKLAICVMMVLAMAGIASAACTVLSPSSSATLSGGTYNVSIECAVLTNVTNCSLTFSTSTAGVGTATFTAITYNATLPADKNNMSNASVNTFQGSDGTGWAITGTCYNESGATTEAVTSVTGLTIDNTAPVFGTTTPATATEITTGTQTFTAVCSNSTAATLYIEATPYTMTESSDTCSLELNDLPDGTTTWYITASDGTTTTNLAKRTLDINKPGGWVYPSSQAVATTTTTPGGKSNMTMLIIIGVVAFLLFSGSGKKKRR